MSAPIAVLAIRRLDSKSSSVKAFCDLQLGGVTIKSAKIIQQDGQRAWVAMPSVKTDHGWQNVVEVTSKDLRQRITEVVLAAWGTHQPDYDQRDTTRTTAAVAGAAILGQRDTGRDDRPFDDRLDDIL
jgi:DNA-binding cell septation regulator SpoVG